ncbi:CLUMA_CG001893, isoform A [Clunio marinus]|uniref:Tetraspanin n=1 Tax=Clunio marinus TaxID=568069 RepID=A0A1J1HL27_9DIPT|nr:CLUMA_CG001893, isoform A [Clunio marinus]
MPIRKIKKLRRDRTEISCCLKYSILSVNMICGLFLLSVGVWALNEKNVFSNLSSNLLYDPAFVFIISGSITFLIGFTGCVGSLRENTLLLSIHSILLIVLLLLEIGLGVLTFILKDKGWIKSQATYGLRNFILHYREDADQQNLIDYIQQQWECCGIDTPSDWDANRYFNCTSSILGSREACGVPFSCCKTNSNDIIANKQCGYDVRKEGFSLEVSKIIYERGCILAGEELFEENLITISSLFIICIFVQILGICFAQNLRQDILAQKAKWK